MSKIKNNLSVVLISAIGTLIVISVFFYDYWDNKKELDKEQEQGAQGEITREGKEEIENKDIEKKSQKDNEKNADKTQDWQTYNNTYYNYALKYPNNWYEGPENREDSWIVYFLNNKVDQINEIDLIDGVRVEILVQGNPRGLTLSEWAKEGHIFGGEPKSSKRIKVAGSDAIKEEINYNGTSLTVYFFRGEDVYTISYSGTESDYNKYKGEFETILESFTFNNKY